MTGTRLIIMGWREVTDFAVLNASKQRPLVLLLKVDKKLKRY